MASSKVSSYHASSFACFFGVLLAGVLSGCGSGGIPATPGHPDPDQTTSVSVMLTSSGNAFTSVFYLQLESLKLTSKSGKTVSLFAGDGTTPITEFAHLNGVTEPFVSLDVPQDVYTSASATVSTAEFTCVVNTGQNLDDSTYSQPDATVTIDLPEPITVASPAMGLVLNLDLAKSETYESCVQQAGTSFSIQPAFQMTAAPFGSSNSALTNSNAATLRGIIGSVGSNGSFTLNSADGPPLSVTATPSTIFQGISGTSALIAGMQADMDTIFASDGSLQATRIEVDDPNTTDLNVFSGPLLEVPNAVPTLVNATQLQYGFLSSQTPAITGAQEFDYSNANFQISTDTNNLQTLPFVPSFTAANMVPGQDISLTTHESSLTDNGSAILSVSTVTLKPQTIDGTIESTSTSGQFQVYTVSLASYDLFPMLANQPGQNILISQPDTVMVYTDGGTLNTSSSLLSSGSLLRFRGLVFNDGGTLRMDCSQIETGVSE